MSCSTFQKLIYSFTLCRSKDKVVILESSKINALFDGKRVKVEGSFLVLAEEREKEVVRQGPKVKRHWPKLRLCSDALDIVRSKDS